MHRFLRRPLTWMVAAECCLLSALGVVTWSLVAGHRAGPPAAGIPASGLGQPAPANLAPPPQPIPPPGSAAGVPPRPAAGPTPGLRQDAGFASRLNTDSAAWETAQWRLTSAVIAWTRRYLDGVVVPAIIRAEQRGRGPSPVPSPPPHAGPIG